MQVLTPATTTKITVRRAATVTPGASNDRPVTRLSRNTSDLSDVSTTTPITPAPESAVKFHPRRLHHRQPDNDSSSCSSTEELDKQSTSMWNDNPVYADQRRQRQRPHRSRHGATVDTGPLDDILTETEPASRQWMTKSNFELHRSSSPPADSVVKPTSAVTPPTSASVFKSEPDITALDNLLIIQDSPAVSDHGTMIDCISVAAPDDTVIKPSQLRASMRQRRTPTSSSSTDDFAVGRSGADQQIGTGSGSPLQRNSRRGGSLRETRRSPAVEGETMGFVRKKVAAIDVPSSPSVLSSSSSVTAGPYTFSPPLSSDGTCKKIFQPPDLEILPSLPRNPAYTMSLSKTVNSAAYEANGVGNLSYDQLLHDYKEVPL